MAQEVIFWEFNFVNSNSEINEKKQQQKHPA